MKKTTQKLSKRLAQYGALTVAIAGVADASGQIVYTDVDPDFVGNDTNIGLDLNNDTIFDFVIIDAPSPAVAVVAYNSLSGNSFLGSQPLYTYPFALNSGDPISAGQAAWYGGTTVGTLNYVSCYSGIGGSNWCGVTDKYLGLRFLVSGNTHYGWARLDVSLSGDSYTLKDYAYNSTPDEPIMAGQTLGTDEFSAAKLARVSASNKVLTISELQGDAAYRVITMTGKIVHEGKTATETQHVSLESIADGIYIVEVTDLNSNNVLRKKVVL